MTLTIKGPHYPALFTDGAGKIWLVSGHVWKEVPKRTRLKDVKYVRPYVAVTKAPSSLKEVTREFPSARDARLTYTTRIRSDGLKSCTCSGFVYRRFCKHVDALKKEVRWK